MTKTIRLILIILLFTLSMCKPKIESLPKEIAEKYMISFVLNPNGIAYYKDPTDLKSKLGIIPYKAMFGREEKDYPYGYGKNRVSAIKIWHSGKEGYILYGDHTEEIRSDVISFENESSSRRSFAVIESKEANLYNSPFLDSEPARKLNQFTLLEKVMACEENSDWMQGLDNGKYFYTKATIQRYSSEELANLAIQKKALNSPGYVKIHADKSEFLSDPEFKKVVGNKDSLLSPVWDLYKSDYSELVGDKRYYKIRASLGENEYEYQIRRGKKIITVNKNPFSNEYLFVSEDNIEYIPDEKLTAYTIEHTNFKGDKKILYAIARQYPTSNYDLTNVAINKLGSTQKGEGYFLIQFENSSFLFKNVDGNYEAANYEYGFPVVPGSVTDIDGDGLSEFLVVWDGRGAVGYTLFGMKDGIYQPLADVETISSKTNGIIHKVNFIQNEENESYHRAGFRAYGSFRYNKGILTPVKIKYRKFFEMAEKDP